MLAVAGGILLAIAAFLALLNIEVVLKAVGYVAAIILSLWLAFWLKAELAVTLGTDGKPLF